MDVGVVPWRTNRVLAKCVGECYSAIGGHELVCVRGVHVEALISGPLLEFGSQVINHDPQYMAVWFAEFSGATLRQRRHTSNSRNSEDDGSHWSVVDATWVAGPIVRVRLSCLFCDSLFDKDFILVGVHARALFGPRSCIRVSPLVFERFVGGHC